VSRAPARRDGILRAIGNPIVKSRRKKTTLLLCDRVGRSCAASGNGSTLHNYAGTNQYQVSELRFGSTGFTPSPGCFIATAPRRGKPGLRPAIRAGRLPRLIQPQKSPRANMPNLPSESSISSAFAWIGCRQVCDFPLEILRDAGVRKAAPMCRGTVFLFTDAEQPGASRARRLDDSGPESLLRLTPDPPPGCRF
jgi:hypothetical protein